MNKKWVDSHKNISVPYICVELQPGIVCITATFLGIVPLLGWSCWTKPKEFFSRMGELYWWMISGSQADCWKSVGTWVVFFKGSKRFPKYLGHGYFSYHFLLEQLLPCILINEVQRSRFFLRHWFIQCLEWKIAFSLLPWKREIAPHKWPNLWRWIYRLFVDPS